MDTNILDIFQGKKKYKRRWFTFREVGGILCSS